MFYYHYFFLPIKLSKLKTTRRPLLSGAGSQRDDPESFVLVQPRPTLWAVRLPAGAASLVRCMVLRARRRRVQRWAVCQSRRQLKSLQDENPVCSWRRGWPRGQGCFPIFSYRGVRVWISGDFLINGNEVCFSSWFWCSAKNNNNKKKMDQI